MLKYTFPFLFILMVLTTSAQKKQGSWHDYLSYNKAIKLALAPGKVYCATEGGLMISDLEDNSVTRFSDAAKLSDFSIETIAFSKENNVLVIAYKNSNIDLAYGNKVVNLSDIKRKQMTGSKAINNISFVGKEAFLSCGFGIVVLNLQKQEVKETYFIGEGGTALTVFDVEEYAGSLFAATENGILSAPLNNGDLADFNRWTRVENIPNSTGKFNHLETHAGRLIANYTTEQWAGDAMYAFNGNTWEPFVSGIQFAHDIQQHGKYLTVAGRTDVYVIDESNSIVKQLNNYQFGNVSVPGISPLSAIVADNGVLWVADYDNSLVKVNDTNFEKVSINGPFDNFVYGLYPSEAGLWVAPGGTKGWERPRFQRFKEGRWEYFTQSNHPELDGFFNILCMASDPADAEHVFVGSWGGGLLEYRNGEFQNRFTNKNSPLKTALPKEPDAPYVRVAGLDFDSQGNLWITNSNSPANLFMLAPDGKWKEFILPELATDYNIGKVVVTQNDDKWVVALSGHDAYVVDKTGDRKKRLLVTSYFNNGTIEEYTRMNDIYSIVEDNEGAIWIGTSKGVAVYNNPSRIWDTESFYAQQPSLDLNDGIYHPLLKTETVTAIAVDGANRKWLGTQNSGVYLVSESGDREILHFTTDNSPLFSNDITSIGIDQKSGEVFIGTDQGLISYMGEAIGGKKSYAEAYVYPNPVRETYDGPITVTGLIENSEVKITDIAGNLVFRTTSLGGQAIWDGRNLNGNRVKTGVYLIFCNDNMGEETHIEKLLFIH